MAKARIIDKGDVMKVAKDILKLPSKSLWVDYDEQVDVLYISFRKPQNATDSVMEDDIIYHYDDEDVVGITLLNIKEKGESN